MLFISGGSGAVTYSHMCNGMWSRTLQKFIIRLSGNTCFINLFSVLPSTNSAVVGMRIGQFEILKLEIFFFFEGGRGGWWGEGVNLDSLHVRLSSH